MRISDIPEIAKLSAQEKILLVEDIWDSIALDESVVPVPHSHRDELDRRLRMHESAHWKPFNSRRTSGKNRKKL